MDIAAAWKQLVTNLNANGIPLPMARDPKTGGGSVSLTMVIVSFGLMTACTLLAVAMVVSKLTALFTAPDVAMANLKEAFLMAFQMAGLSCGLYWGRKFQRSEKGAVEIQGEEKQ